MPALTFVFAIVAIVCIGSVIRLLSRPAEKGRGWRVGALLLVACAALIAGGYNAVLVQQKAQAKQALERGRELMQQGKPDEAESEFKRAAELDPKSKEAKEELKKVEKARREAQKRTAQGTGTVAPSGGGGAGGGPAGVPASAQGHPQRIESQVRITSYAIDVSLDLQKHSLAAEAQFSVRAKEGKLRTFDLALSPECKIQEITVNGQPVETKREDEWVHVTVKDPVTSRQDAEVFVRYRGFGKDRILPGGDVISPEGSYLRPESRWCPAIGYLEFRSPVRTRVTVPKGQSALAAGTLKSQQPGPSGGTTYEWDCPRNAMGVAIAAGPWERVEGKAGKVPITVLLWKKHADRGTHILAVAKQAVEQYSGLYGDYPYDKLAIAEIPFFPGGYSPTSMVFLGELLFEKNSTIKKMFDAVVAHEISHQWWGNLVMPQGPGAGWLAEGFAEYSSLLYVEHTAGEKAFRRALWDAKQQYHILNQNPPEEAIIDTDPFNQQGAYMGVVYSKGAYVLHMLRYVVGDQAFFATLKSFLSTHQYAIATIAEFTAEAEKQSGQDLDWFFDEWLNRTGTIELVYDWSSKSLGNGQWETIVTLDQQSKEPYRMPIELQVVTPSGKSLDRGKLTGAHDEFRFVTRDEPRDIDVDPNDNLLLAVPRRVTAAKP